jgi:hypothetical protein
MHFHKVCACNGAIQGGVIILLLDSRRSHATVNPAPLQALDVPSSVDRLQPGDHSRNLSWDYDFEVRLLTLCYAKFEILCIGSKHVA